MELMNNPMNVISNQNENLIQSGQNRQQNTNVNQYFVEIKDDQSSKKYSTFYIRFICINIAVYVYSICILSGFLIPAIIVPKLDLYLRKVMISLGVIIVLILFTFCTNKIKLIKDASNGKVVIKVINYLCCPKKKINLDIENTHFHVLEQITKLENGDLLSYRFLIINDYKNLVGIDLDTSNIKQKPAKFLYSFNLVSKGKYEYREFVQILNNFIGPSGVYDNPLFFNINNYLNKDQNIFYFPQTLSKYMKFSVIFLHIILKILWDLHVLIFFLLL